MTWFGICLTYIRFYKGFKLQGFDRTTLPYYNRLQPFAAWYAMIMSFLICFVSTTIESPVPALGPMAHWMGHLVLWLGCLPQGQLEHGVIRHELHSIRAVPDSVHRFEALLPHAAREARRHGLHFGPEGDRGGVLRRASSAELGRALLGLAGE